MELGSWEMEPSEREEKKASASSAAKNIISVTADISTDFRSRTVV